MSHLFLVVVFLVVWEARYGILFVKFWVNRRCHIYRRFGVSGVLVLVVFGGSGRRA